MGVYLFSTELYPHPEYPGHWCWNPDHAHPDENNHSEDGFAHDWGDYFGWRCTPAPEMHARTIDARGQIMRVWDPVTDETHGYYMLWPDTVVDEDE